MRKFSPEQVKAMRGLKRKGWSTYRIAQKIGCSAYAIQRLCSGETYSDIPNPCSPSEMAFIIPAERKPMRKFAVWRNLSEEDQKKFFSLRKKRPGRQPIPDAEIYRMIGRPDLVEVLEKWHTSKKRIDMLVAAE